MQWLDEHNTAEYLRLSGAIGATEPVEVVVLSGGVSNQVLYVKSLQGRRPDFVLKQARPQLRTPQPWFSSVDRIWREVEVMRVCQEVLEQDESASIGRRIEIPRIAFEDRTCYAFAMSAAPREHVVWKTQLLSGEADEAIAGQCGRLLGTLHSRTWDSADVQNRLGDRTLFDQLRLDPYYRTVAAIDGEAGELMQRLIASVWSYPRSLVHADFSPKNLLVYPDGLMMVDFETGHYGDPAFDLGFFLSHLVLKAVYHAPRHAPMLALTQRFWEAYEQQAKHAAREEYNDLVARGVLNFAGCMWARIDGKSRVEYLLDSPRREPVRTLCRELLREQPASWEAAMERVEAMLEQLEPSSTSASGV